MFCVELDSAKRARTKSIENTGPEASFRRNKQNDVEYLSGEMTGERELNAIVAATALAAISAREQARVVEETAENERKAIAISRETRSVTIHEQPLAKLSIVGSPVQDKNESDTTKKTKFRRLADVMNEKMGSVDENRVIFPELATGEVPRMWSNLKYTVVKGAGDDSGSNISATRSAGSTLGAAALVASSTLGAGVLALPAATAPAGFLSSSAAMIVAWVYMNISGLLLAELYLNRVGETGRTRMSMMELYRSILGERWSVIGTSASFFLYYAVTLACISQGGVYLGSLLDVSLPVASSAIYAGIVGVCLGVAKPDHTKKANNVLAVAMAATFLGVLGVGAGHANFGALLSIENQHPENVINAFPILFLSLVYQNIIPTVVTQLEGDRTKIITSILGGTSLPMVMYLFWNAIIIGNGMNASEDILGLINSGEMDPVAYLQSGGQVDALRILVGTFSGLAVTAGLVSSVGGLSDSWTDVVGLPITGSKYERWKPAIYSAILVPPLLFTMSHPDVFYQALSYGGAFGVSTLFLVLPPIMAWKARYQDVEKPIMTLPLVPGGKLSLGSLWKAAGTLIVEQGAEKLGIIEWIREQLSHYNL